MSAIDLSVVVKYNLYPKNDPTGYAVGFEVTVVGGEKFYIDTVVSLQDSQGLSSSEIVDEAWQQVRSNAITRADQLADYSGVIGRIVEQRERSQEYFPWVQPGGAGDEYHLGDRVIYEGYIWESTIDNNVWVPGEFGWKIVGIAEEGEGDIDSGEDPNGSDEPEPWQEWDGNNENLYQEGDRVTHNGFVWVSTENNNHWEPGEFGWEIENG